MSTTSEVRPWSGKLCKPLSAEATSWAENMQGCVCQSGNECVCACVRHWVAHSLEQPIPVQKERSLQKGSRDAKNLLLTRHPADLHQQKDANTRLLSKL